MRRLDVWLDGILANLADPARQSRTAGACLIAYVVLWTIYGAISKSSQDIHFDMGEAVVWFQQGWLTTPKHPPFSAWLPGLWFMVFPRQDWAYYLLAMCSAGVGLACAWQLSRQFLKGDKLAVATLLLGFVPFYNFHALKFNANTVMIPLWGLATLAFLHSFRTRTVGSAAIAGLAAAAVMLGKYWGIFLIAGFGVGAIFDPRREAYFRSAAPWISIAAGFAALSPHLTGVAQSEIGTISYALHSHIVAWYVPLQSAPRYLAAVVAYLAVPLIVFVLAARPDRAAVFDTIVPRDPDRRLAIVIMCVPVALPLIVAPMVSSEINALWTMAGFGLLPAVLLGSPLIRLPRRMSRVILGVALVFPAIVLAASPLIALNAHLKRHQVRAAHYQLLAKEIEARWSAANLGPLRQLGGETSLINGTAFYMARVPTTLDVKKPEDTPWISNDRIVRDGIAFICQADDTYCIAKSHARSEGLAPKADEAFTLSRRFMGINGGPQQYVLMMVPPAAAAR